MSFAKFFVFSILFDPTVGVLALGPSLRREFTTIRYGPLVTETACYDVSGFQKWGRGKS